MELADIWTHWWLLAMVTLNTGLNTIVFFKHRFRKAKDGKE